MSRPTYYRKLKAGEIPNETSPSALLERDSYGADTPVSRPVSRPAVTDLGGIDFAKFGITGIRVMRGTDVVRAWVMPGRIGAERLKRDGAASLELRGAHNHLRRNQA